MYTVSSSTANKEREGEEERQKAQINFILAHKSDQ